MGFDVREYVKKKKENNTGDRKGFSVIDYIQNKREGNSVSGFNVADYSSYKRATNLNSSSLGIINDYNEKVKNGKYLSADDLASYQKATNDFISSTDILRGIGKKYGSNYTEEEDKNWEQSKVDIGSNFTNLSKFYSNWKTEDDYNKYLKAQEEYNEKFTINLEEYATETKAMEDTFNSNNDKIYKYSTNKFWKEGWVSQGDEYQDRLVESINTYLTQMIAYANSGGEGADPFKNAKANYDRAVEKWNLFYGKLPDELSYDAYKELKVNNPNLKEEIATRKAYYAEAEYLQKGQTMTNEYLEWDAIEGNDIGDLYNLDAVKELAWSDEADQRASNIQTAINGMKLWEYAPEGSEYKKYKDMYAQYVGWWNEYHGDVLPWQDELVKFTKLSPAMKDNEIETYLYFLNTHGAEKANEYLYSLESILNQRSGAAIASVWDDNWFTRTLFGIGAGLSSWAEGIHSSIESLTDSGEYKYDPYSPMEYASGMVRESYETDFGKGVYDVMNSIGNMAPSVVLSFAPYVGTVLSLASTFASSGGNAYKEMRRAGYSANQARVYGALVGGSEAGLQYLLGGISKLGGKLAGKISGKAIAAVDSAFARVAITVGTNMISEGFEEGLQTVLEPWFKSIATGVDFDAPDIADVLYASLLGAMTSFLLEGGKTAINTGIESHINKETYGGMQNELVEAGLTLPEGSDGRIRAEKYQKQLDSGKNLTGTQLGLLVESNQQGMKTQDTSKIQKAVENRLTELGEKGNVSEIAEIVAKQTAGEKISLYEKAVLKNNANANKVITELNYSKESVANKGNDVGYKLSDNSKNLFTPKEKTSFDKDAFVNAYEEIETYHDNVEKILNKPTTKGQVLDSVKNKTTHNGEEVTVQGVTKIKDGKVTVKLNNGKEVNVRDVKFTSREEQSVYEAVANMSVDTANEFIDGFYSQKLRGQVEGGMLTLNVYSKAFKDALKYGQYGFPDTDLNNGEFTSLLSEGQRKIVYNRGKIDGITSKRSTESLTEKTQGVNQTVNQSSTESSTVSETEKVAKNQHKKGKVTFDKGVRSHANTMQKDQIKILEATAEAMGINYNFFESTVDEEGERGANGWYNLKTKTIHIDIHAGKDANGVILFTASHELTHFIRDFSETKFKEFADFLFAKYGEMGLSVEDLIARKLPMVKEQAVKDGLTLSPEELYDLAYEEVVADACERMLTDSNAIEQLVEKFGKKDKTFLAKIKKFFVEILAKIRQIFAKIEPDSLESNLTAKMKDTEALLNKWVEALTDAIENYQAWVNNKTTESKVIEGNLEAKDITNVLSRRYVDEHKTDLATNYNSKESTVSLEDLTKRYDAIVRIWDKIGGELNSKFLNEWDNKIGKDRTFDVFKAQAGYKYNIELSSMCKKGVPLFEAIDTIVKDEIMQELDLKTLNKEEKEILYDILKSHNFEIPCAICYVEQARQREGVIIDAFLDGRIDKNSKGEVTKVKVGWNQVLADVQKEMAKNGVDYTFPAVSRDIATDKYVAEKYTMDEVTQTAFYNALQKLANKAIEQYNKEKAGDKKFKPVPLLKSITPNTVKASLGRNVPNLKLFKILFENPSSRFTIDRDLLYSSVTTRNLSMSHNSLYGLFNQQGGVSGYKSKQTPIVYWGDILGKKWNPSTIRKEGGIRNQSNSDFQMYTLLDQAQMYIDFTAKGYYLQAYTKVLAELKLFGLSKGKINASLIPKVHIYYDSKGQVDIAKTMENAGLDENGNPIYDDFEGINHTEAFMLIEDKEYSKNITGICIGYSDNHIFKLLDDSRVQLIIGFHDKTDDGTKRYRGARYAKNYNGLNEAYDIAEDKTKHIGFNQFVKNAESMFNYNSKTETFEGTVDHNGKTYEADDIPMLAGDLYLEHCEKKGYRPAYNGFKGHPNYYKLLADFGLKDSEGHYAPHQKVAYNMPTEVPYLDANGNKQYMKTEDYIKAELEKELAVRDSLAEDLADKSEEGIISQFKKAYTDPNYRKELTKKANEPTVLKSSRESSYMDAVNSGNVEAAQQMVDEAAREAGYTTKAFHGTHNFGRTVFNKYDVLFLTDREYVAKGFSNGTGRRAISRGEIDAFADDIGSVLDFVNHNSPYRDVRLLSETDIDKLIKQWTLTDKDIREFKLSKEDVSRSKARIDRLLEVKRGIQSGETYYIGTNIHDSNFPTNSNIASEETIREIASDTILRKGQNAGVYEMYANIGKTVIVEGNGNYYTNLSVPNELRRYARESEKSGATTDQIVRMAHEAGYNSVTFKNIREGGDYGNAGLSTVYAVFNPTENVKSADPVTYDDNGNVIPLSERFNSENNDIRYSLRSVDPVQPTSNKWSRTSTTEEVKAQFPNLWDVSAEESEVRNPTQISGTVRTYRKIYDFLKKSGFKGTILDASSGLGYGTKAGIEEYGFKVDDIEPYPDKSYSPKYTDYSTLNKKYDVIISNAVLNVIPQDQRDALVVKMGELLKNGGRMFINVRGDDVKNASSKVAINEELMEYYISNTGSYQKGFTKSELVAYLQDALGDGYTVMPTTFFGKTSAVVTKKDTVVNEGQVLYSIRRIVGDSGTDYGEGVYLDSQLLTNLTDAERIEMVKLYVHSIGGSVFTAFDSNHNPVDVHIAESNNKFKNKSGKKKSVNKDLTTKYIDNKTKQESIALIDELIQTSKFDSQKTPLYSHDWLDNYGKNNWEYWVTYVQDKQNTIWEATLNIANTANGEKILYDINPIKKMEQSVKSDTSPSPNNITHPNSVVNQNTGNSQNLHQYRDTSMSTRNLLANALESTAQNDIERQKLAQYKEKIDLINSEEQKLKELKGKIKDLSFAKGKRDTEQINKLQFEANQTANRINTYDKQLLKLEASKPLKDVLQREKQLAYKRAEQKGKEALADYKEKSNKTIREIMNRAAESRKKGVERRTMTELRGDIKKVVSELNQLLLHGTKERNIKFGLQEAVADALDAINLDTVDAENRIAKLQQDLMKAKTPEEIEKIQHSIDFIRNQGDNFADKLEKLRRAYSEIRNNANKDFPSQFKEEAQLIHDRIEMVIQDVGDTPLRNMTLAQLQEVYDMYKMVLTTIRLANNIWRENKLIDLQGDASTIMQDFGGIKPLKAEELKDKNAFREFSWNEMTPYHAFQRIGSNTFAQYYQDIVEGQNTYARDIDEARNFAHETREKYDYKKWDMDKVYTFTLKDGRTFKTTLKHMLSIYAYSKREQALAHMREGGFFYNDKAKFRSKGWFNLIARNESGYKIDEEILAEIKDSLTKEQIGYVDEMQDYLTKMGEKGNEVTRVMWGIDVFKEKVYFPLKSKDDFIKRSTETAQNVSLKNDGMTKETKPNASNPIVLEAFDDVWASHVERMSQYHAFVIPIDNLNKVLNYGTWAGTDSVSVSTMIRARHGSEAKEYIEQFIKDLNGGVTNQGARNPFESFFGKFKKTAVGMSLSTIVQQPTAILRAFAIVDAKYFVGKPDMRTLGKKWSEIKIYAPIAIIKEIGGFDAGGGRQASNWLNKDTLKGKDKVMDTIDDISMKGAELADKLGWVTIWDAVKREVKANNPTMDTNSEAFLEKCGKRFTEVIVQTQVYDSTLSRSGYMRSKNSLVKMATAFMGEPTISFNMVANAVIQAKRGGKGAKAKAVRVIASVYLAQIAATVASSFIYALRDDDEDESYWEKYMQAFGGEFISDIVLAPVTSLPFIKDIVSIFQGWDVERSDMSIIKDIKDAFDGLDSGNKSTYRKIEDLAGAIASIFGVPLKNLLRTGRETYNFFENIFDGIEGGDMGDAFVEGITGDEKTKAEKLYEAIINGDKARLEVYKKQYKDEDALISALRGEIKDRFLSEEIDSDTAEQYLIEHCGMSENDAYWKMKEWESELINGDSEDYSKYNSFYTAVESGKNLKAVIKEYTDNGVSKQTLASQITSHFKPLYKEMSRRERANIKGYLLNAYALLGYNRAEKSKDIDNWLKDKK